jgi:hypothetical protein
VCTARCDRRQDDAVMPLGATPGAAVGTKRWNSSPTGVRPAPATAARQQRRSSPLAHLRPAGGAAAEVGGEVKALHRGDSPVRGRPRADP